MLLTVYKTLSRPPVHISIARPSLKLHLALSPVFRPQLLDALSCSEADHSTAAPRRAGSIAFSALEQPLMVCLSLFSPLSPFSLSWFRCFLQGAISHTSYPLFLFLFSFWPLACSLFSPSVLSRGSRLALGSDCRKERGREGGREGDVVSICFGFVSVVVDLFPFTFLWVLSSLYPHPPHCRESVLVFVIPYPPHSSAYPNLPSSVPVKALFFKRVACNAAV